MPVVDSAHRLVGAVTVDDVLDHSLPRDWRDRDVEDSAGAPVPSSTGTGVTPDVGDSAGTS
jgi:Mg/Co/Ni transporter MgtE